MKNVKNVTRHCPAPSIALITNALNQAALDAVEAHRAANQPLVLWEHEQIKLVSSWAIRSNPVLPKRRRRNSA
jgi:hypothetical protein